MNWLFTRAGVTLTRAANQAISTATITDISWDTVVADNSPSYITVTGATVTIPSGQGGVYGAVCNIAFSGPVGARTFLQPVYNGNATDTTFPYGRTAPNTANNDEQFQSLAWKYPMAAGDTLKWQVFQASGGSLNLRAQLALYRETGS